jgi:hypothetical protein
MDTLLHTLHTQIYYKGFEIMAARSTNGSWLFLAGKFLDLQYGYILFNFVLLKII